MKRLSFLLISCSYVLLAGCQSAPETIAKEIEITNTSYEYSVDIKKDSYFVPLDDAEYLFAKEDQPYFFDLGITEGGILKQYYPIRVVAFSLDNEWVKTVEGDYLRKCNLTSTFTPFEYDINWSRSSSEVKGYDMMLTKENNSIYFDRYKIPSDTMVNSTINYLSSYIYYNDKQLVLFNKSLGCLYSNIKLDTEKTKATSMKSNSIISFNETIKLSGYQIEGAYFTD